MRVERYASECALCRATIYVPAGLGGIHSAEELDWVGFIPRRTIVGSAPSILNSV